MTGAEKSSATTTTTTSVMPRSNPRSQTHWIKSCHHRLMKICSDTWLLEICAIVLCCGSCIAIGVLLKIWSGNEVPRLNGGFTVNAVVSILATASKSAMLFAVSSCIAQNKWTWFISPRPLSDAQVFDDATRGPLGATTYLLGRTALSIGVLGAFVTLGSLAFDPFVQQAVRFPLRSVEHPSSAAVVQKGIRLPFTSMEDFATLDLETLLFNAVNFMPSDLQPYCPSGNCTWPSVKTISLCHRCENRSLTLPPTWDWQQLNWSIPFNSSDAAFDNEVYQSTNPMADVGSFPIPMMRSRPAKPVGSNYKLLPYYLQQVVMAAVELTLFIPHTRPILPVSYNGSPGAGLYDDLLLGTSPPYIAYGFPTLTWSESGPAIQDFTLCTLETCLKEYSISMQSSQPTYNRTATHFGSYHSRNFSLPADVELQAVCWQPDGSGDLLYKDLYHTSAEGSLNMCPFDEAGGGFCTCSQVRDDATFRLPEYLNAVGTPTPTAWFYTWNETKPFNTMWVNLDDTPPYNLTNLDYSPVNANAQYTAGSFLQKVATEGPEKMMSSLSDAFDFTTLSVGSVNVTGNISTMLSHVSVQWWWLFFPATLNILAAFFLLMTMCTTRVNHLPLWKSSLMTAYYHGLEPVVQTSIDRSSTKISAIHLDAEKIKVRFRNVMRAEEIMFVSGK